MLGGWGSDIGIGACCCSAVQRHCNLMKWLTGTFLAPRYAAATTSEEYFAAADVNKDGVLDAQEFGTYVRKGTAAAGIGLSVFD